MWLAVAAALAPADECTGGCLCELAYGAEAYAGAAAAACLAASDVPASEWDVDHVLADPADQAAFAARGLTPDSSAAQLVKGVNRVAFLADYLTTHSHAWTSAALRSVLQTVFVLDGVLAGRAATARVVDVGCGVGFLAAVLARTQAQQVVCLEYEHWVHEASIGLFRAPAHVWAGGGAEGSKVELVEGDGVTMLDVSGQSLGQFDIVVFSMGLAAGAVPAALADSLAEGGSLFAPQCASQAVIDKPEVDACAASWRLFTKQGGVLVEQALGYELPATFMLPYSEQKEWPHGLRPSLVQRAALAAGLRPAFALRAASFLTGCGAAAVACFSVAWYKRRKGAHAE